MAAPLDRRITLQRLVSAENTLGEAVGEWGLLALVWASVNPVSDRERIAASEKGAVITDRFQVRYAQKLADLTAKDRIKYEGRTYEISGIKPIGRRQHLEITAAARADL